MEEYVSKQRSKRRSSRARHPILVLAITGIVLLGGLGLWSTMGSALPAGPSPQGGDFANVTPQWLSSAPARAQRAYIQVLRHRDELGYVSCYCGCEGIGHVSVVDCVVDNVAANGSITYDRHAVG
jgi:hypothetical protein